MKWCSKEENRHLDLCDYGGNIMLFNLRYINYVSYYLYVRGGEGKAFGHNHMFEMSNSRSFKTNVL